MGSRSQSRIDLTELATIAGTVALCALLFPEPAFAYVGLGAGLSALGSLFSIIVAVFLMLAGFIWYPVKRLLRRLSSKPKDNP